MDGLGVDALIAFDFDRCCTGRRRQENWQQESEEQDQPEEMTLKEFHYHPVPASVVPIRTAGPSLPGGSIGTRHCPILRSTGVAATGRRQILKSPET